MRYFYVIRVSTLPQQYIKVLPQIKFLTRILVIFSLILSFTLIGIIKNTKLLWLADRHEKNVNNHKNREKNNIKVCYI